MVYCSNKAPLLIGDVMNYYNYLLNTLYWIYCMEELLYFRVLEGNEGNNQTKLKTNIYYFQF